MTPRLPLAAAALAAALVSPASAAPAQPGLWWGIDGFVYHGYAWADGVVTWPDLRTSWCSAYVGGAGGDLTCTGSVSFSLTDCRGSTVWGVSMSLVCTGAGGQRAEATAVMVGSGGPFTGTVTYAVLPA